MNLSVAEWQLILGALNSYWRELERAQADLEPVDTLATKIEVYLREK